MMAAVTNGTSGRAEVTDPVCGEVFPPELAVFHSEHAGETIHFCSRTCKESFDTDPDAYPLSEVGA